MPAPPLADPPPNKWIMADHCCDKCGWGPWERPEHLLAHRNRRDCLKRQRELAGDDAGRRLDNVKRRMAIQLVPFLKFLKTTVKEQRRYQTRIVAKRWIPFGRGHKVRTVDVHQMLRRCMKGAAARAHARGRDANTQRTRAQAAKTKRIRQVALAGASALLWTTRWADMLCTSPGFPAAWSVAYEARLRRALLACKQQKKQFVNVAITNMRGHSIMNTRGRKLRKKVDAIIGMVRGVLQRAPLAAEQLQSANLEGCMVELAGPGLPYPGYSAKFASLLLKLMLGLPVLPEKDAHVDSGHHMAGGALDVLAHLTGDQVTTLKNNPSVAKMRLGALCDLLREQWGSVPPRVPLPVFFEDDVNVMLCCWGHNGRTEVGPGELSHTMDACISP